MCHSEPGKVSIATHLSKIPLAIPEWTKQIPSFPTLGYMSGGSIKKLIKIMGLVFEKNGWQVRWK